MCYILKEERPKKGAKSGDPPKFRKITVAHTLTSGITYINGDGRERPLSVCINDHGEDGFCGHCDEAREPLTDFVRRDGRRMTYLGGDSEGIVLLFKLGIVPIGQKPEGINLLGTEEVVAVMRRGLRDNRARWKEVFGDKMPKVDGRFRTGNLRLLAEIVFPAQMLGLIRDGGGLNPAPKGAKKEGTKPPIFSLDGRNLLHEARQQ